MENGVARVRGDVERVTPNPNDFVLILPDEGRHRSLTHIREKSGLPSVGFDKTRISGSDVRMKGLTDEEIALVE